MNAKKLFFILVPFMALFISSCDSTESNGGPAEYVSLNAGDIRQYTSVLDSKTYYQNWEVKCKTHREDGLEIYATEWTEIRFTDISDVVSSESFSGSYLIRDGYFYSTEMYKTQDSLYKNNPYNEQKLAKVSPHPGETWVRNYEFPDTFKAMPIGTMSTPAGEFSNVYEFYVKEIGLHIYYARDFGHIGSIRGNGDQFLVNYIKVNGKERGQFISSNNSGTKKLDKPASDRIRKSIIGQL